jgi:hypothetical protein
MSSSPRRKPLWRWEAFLFGVVLVLAVVGSVLARAPWGVAGAVLTFVLLVVAVAAAVLLVLPLLRRGGRDSENSRRAVDRAAVQELPAAGERMTVPVLETKRRQLGIEAARNRSAGEPLAVLTPDASRWLGRRLRVAVDLVADDGTVYRAGFVPPEIDAALDALVRPATAEGRIVEVPVRILGDQPPFRVEIRVPATADTAA